MRWQIWTLKCPIAIHVGIRRITTHSLNHRPKVKKDHLVSWINKVRGRPGFSFIKQGPGWYMLRAKGSGMGFLGSSNLYHLSKFTRTWLYITTNDHNHSERWKACVQRRPLAEQANDQQQNTLVLLQSRLYGYWCSRKVIGFHYLVRFVQLHQFIQSFLSHLQVFFQRNITFLQNIIIIHLQQEIIEMQINIIKQYSQKNNKWISLRAQPTSQLWFNQKKKSHFDLPKLTCMLE